MFLDLRATSIAHPSSVAPPEASPIFPLRAFPHLTQGSEVNACHELDNYKTMKQCDLTLWEI